MVLVGTEVEVGSMAKSNAVWGLDIGQCALKALRCRPHEKDDRRIVVEAFDYIEYPKILTQPEADAVELVRDALQQFLSRNDVSNDRVAISVAGQNGLARFIKLPPVEAKKIPDIVKYEARQQIPFALEDVVWDYQPLAGGSEEEGVSLEPEVGLFAMKRDQVTRALEPFEEAGIEVDLIQLSPLAVYNYICFDRLEDLQSRTYDPQAPPTSTVVISLGTDTTDLVVTNGYRVWQRNIPIGGSHFTRALSKDLKLTFAKAEHLKRNAMQADDPKAVFQAMRPVFSDLLAEIQRSLGYFTNLNKLAKIGEVVVLGNAMKLPGLQRYLTQNLEQEVKPIESFERLAGGSVTAGAQFKENILSFAPAYGLCVQGLGKAELHTNLLPEEIVRSRLIRAKKPWAVVGVAAVLLGLTINYFMHTSAWRDTDTQAMKDAIAAADRKNSEAGRFQAQRTEIHDEFNNIKVLGDNLVSNVEERYRWLELMKAIDAALPKDARPVEQREETAKDISARNELHIQAMESQHYKDVQANWFSQVEGKYRESRGLLSAESSDEGSFGAEEEGDDAGGIDLSRPGWVIQLTGYHYHNGNIANERGRFVKKTLLRQLEEGSVELPDAKGQMVKVSMADLGISHPWICDKKLLYDETIDPDQLFKETQKPAFGGGGFGDSFEVDNPENFLPGAGEQRGSDPANLITLKRYDFMVQFVWQPTTYQQREELALQRIEKAEREAAEAAEGATARLPDSSTLPR